MIIIFLIIIAIVIIIILIIFTMILQHKNRIYTSSKLQNLIDQINNAKLYEYKYDEKQDENIQNIDKNTTEVHDKLLQLQNNINYIEQNTILRKNSTSQENITFTPSFEANGNLLINGNICISDICINKDDLKKIKNN